MAPNGEANVPSAAEPTEGTVGDDAIMLASTAGSCGEKKISFLLRVIIQAQRQSVVF
jgi:hypothetical protein